MARSPKKRAVRSKVEDEKEAALKKKTEMRDAKRKAIKQKMERRLWEPLKKDKVLKPILDSYPVKITSIPANIEAFWAYAYTKPEYKVIKDKRDAKAAKKKAIQEERERERQKKIANRKKFRGIRREQAIAKEIVFDFE